MQKEIVIKPVDWSPFWVDSAVAIPPRPLHEKNYVGIGDRLRAAAFAELQAENGFYFAAERFCEDVPAPLVESWLFFASEERKHRGWLLERLNELGQRVEERPVKDVLWSALLQCKTAEEFCHFIARAEERGKRAGERFFESLLSVDAVTARIFKQIAEEETRHIAVAYEYFPKTKEIF